MHLMTGFAAHWNKNSNLAWAFDTWFLNVFPRSQPFGFNGGGYATLSFIPTLGTMILGLIAGGVFYCMSWLFKDFILANLKTHLGADAFKGFGSVYEPLLSGAAVLVGFWLILFWLYRKRIFLRI